MSETTRSQRVRDLGDVARDLGKLTEHPSWPALRKQVERRVKSYQDRLARQLTSGGITARPLNQREIDYIRGFITGAQAVLDTPENAMKALDQALRKEGEASDG